MTGSWVLCLEKKVCKKWKGAVLVLTTSGLFPISFISKCRSGEKVNETLSLPLGNVGQSRKYGWIYIFYKNCVLFPI